MRRLALLSLTVALAACAAGSAGPTPKATVAALESALTAADRLAAAYVRLPRCAPATRPLCSDAGTSTRVQAAGLVAYRSVTAAEAAVSADPTASASQTNAALADARGALAAFQAAIPATATAKE